MPPTPASGAPLPDVVVGLLNYSAARARESAQSQMFATVSRRAPPAAQRKERRGKDISGPCQAPLSRGSGILFFIIHHDICKPLICIGADNMMNGKN